MCLKRQAILYLVLMLFIAEPQSNELQNYI